MQIFSQKLALLCQNWSDHLYSQKTWTVISKNRWSVRNSLMWCLISAFSLFGSTITMETQLCSCLWGIFYINVTVTGLLSMLGVNAAGYKLYKCIKWAENQLSASWLIWQCEQFPQAPASVDCFSLNCEMVRWHIP